MPDDKLGFYALLATQDGKGYVGALLITDELGKPVEFRVTYPVKPNLLQKQLYGDSLMPHIGIELCGKPLFQALTNKPSVLLISNAQFLSSLAEGFLCHVACIEPTDSSSQPVPGFHEMHKLNSPSGLFQPIIIRYPQTYDQERRDEVHALLERFFSHVNLIEPFYRIRVAIKALHEQDERFR
jgi:hypothetical protein